MTTNSLLDKMRLWLGNVVLKAVNLNLVPNWMRYTFMQPTFRNLTNEGYKGNGAVFGCISALALAFPEPPLLVWQETDAGRTPLRMHPLSLKLKRPNPDMGLKKFMKFTIVYLAVGGNCYWLKVRSRAGRVVEFWPMHDGQITPIPGGTRLVSHYEFDNGSGQPDKIDPRDIVHLMWMPDPLQPWRGLAPLAAVAREVDTDNEATRYLFSLLKNDAMPRLALVSPETIDDEALRKRLKAEWNQEHGGENRGKVALLEGGLDIKQIALNLRELEFNLLRRVPEARMCAAFRVPPIVAGVNVGLENSTYSNYREAILFFTERTLVPLWDSVDDEVESNLLPEFGGKADEIVGFDTDQVVVLAEKKAASRQWAADGLARGSVLVNEYRSAFGLPRDANGDVYLRGLASMEVPFVAEGRQRGKGQGDNSGQPSAVSGREKKAARTAQERIISAQRVERRQVAGRMESALDNYFGGLADRVIHRARKGLDNSPETKELPRANELLTEQDGEQLEEIVKRFSVELIQLSWGTWDVALDAVAAFDLNDPAVTAALKQAGTRVRQITDTTLEALRDALKYGSDNGWGVNELVRGDPDAGVPGLRDIIEQTYKNRAKTIARTELGTAQNTAAAHRYARAGVGNVRVLDDGFENSHPCCKRLNGTVQTVEWAKRNQLQHPNCVRAIAPEFDDEPTAAELALGELAESGNCE